MTTQVPCILYTADADLARRVTGYIGRHCMPIRIAEPVGLRTAIQQMGPALLLMDLCGPESRTLLPEVRRAAPETLVVAFGMPRSEPALQAESLGVYVVQQADFDGVTLQAMVRQALDHLELVSELRVLRGQGPRAAAPELPPAVVDARPAARKPLPPLRGFGNLQSLYEALVDSIAQTARVMRAGLFLRPPGGTSFDLVAGRGCRSEPAAVRLGLSDPFVRWLEINAQMVCRSALAHVRDVRDQLTLQRMLDLLSAELIVPLHGRDRMLGWFFIGRQVAGEPFAPSDLEDLMQYADQVATAVENAFLYAEVALQKTFAETLLHSIPTGIVATNDKGEINLINEAAEQILDLRRANVMGKPAEAVGSRIAHRLRVTLRSTDGASPVEEWVDSASRRHLEVHAVRLTRDGECLGAVAFVHDRTQARMLQKKQKDLDRSAFWTELAANMSHEIRNPLVAIKTFAQLLPERYADEEFRGEFSSVVVHEVNRLNTIIQQINTFANLPTLRVEKCNVRDAIQRALDLARLRATPMGIDVRMSVGEDLPVIQADRNALSECFAHIIANSMEALRGRRNAQVEITASRARIGTSPSGIEVVIRDNGGGIPEELRENVFSPFCTSKGSGMGLGLPIAQRTVVDHNGSLHIETGDGGTTVTIALPAGIENEESNVEASVDH